MACKMVFRYYFGYAHAIPMPLILVQFVYFPAYSTSNFSQMLDCIVCCNVTMRMMMMMKKKDPNGKETVVIGYKIAHETKTQNINWIK